MWHYIKDDVRAELRPLVGRLEFLVDNLDNKLKALQQQQQQQLKVLTKRLTSMESQMAELVTKLDSQESSLAELSTSSSSERSRVDETANKTASQQTQIDDLTVRLRQVEIEQQVTKSPIRDCSELPIVASTGVYPLSPSLNRSQPPVLAFCDLDTDGGNWTVVQRRVDVRPHQDFLLGWSAYKLGFGELTGEFWWGLEHMSQLTSAQDRQYELRIDLEAFNGEKRRAVYRNFQISNEEDGYLLNASNYTGDAGDGLSYSIGRKFSTPDHHLNDRSGSNCAQRYWGAWWYGSACGYSSLNGRYLGSGIESRTGIWWFSWKKFESLKKTEMKIRPI